MTNAVDLINQGSVDQAIGILDSVMAGTPADNVGGLIARGTAKAMKRDLEGTALVRLLADPPLSPGAPRDVEKQMELFIIELFRCNTVFLYGMQ